MSDSISFLLGAGFSAPAGYPQGGDLNKLLLNCTGNEFAFHSSGVMTISTDGKRPDFGYLTSFDVSFEFCKELIKYFNHIKGYFDYEEFYDFIKDDAMSDPNVSKISQPYLGYYGGTPQQLIDSLDNILSQLITYYLKDRDGRAYYDGEPFLLGSHFPGYTGILNCLKKLSEQSIINVHTLNHDLYFERFNSTEFINGELCDGFEELGSPYYGRLNIEGRIYQVRLERYTGNYNKRIRLYKNHGSRNYGVYFTFNGHIARPDNYIKTRFGIGFGDLYKERNNDKGELEYENCWINYHADILTGTTSKIKRYGEPLLYKILLEHLRVNLAEARMLIVIGYGGRDSEINKLILEHFDHRKKPAFIIDPFPGEPVKQLAARLNATIITTPLHQIKIEELDPMKAFKS